MNLPNLKQSLKQLSSDLMKKSRGKSRMAATALGLAALTMSPTAAQAQGWPANFKGVMLQGFYWDGFDDAAWKNLESQADELAPYFKLVWIPQSGKSVNSPSMGYDDLYWFNDYNSSFGTEAELRSMIKTFKNKGIGTIADVVINHRGTLSNWVDFPVETYNGKTYALKSTDICSGDDGGATKKWADENGYSLSPNADTGEDWGGMRDLDHNSANVQTVVKAYLDFLLKDLGYAGFRYDMVKGYAGKFTGIYNNSAKPTYSVGEYWDGNPDVLRNWLNSTKVGNSVMSAVFDFAFRYTCRDAANGNNWSKLDGNGLNKDNSYKRYAVTFVENHDVEYRSASEPQDPIRRDTLAVNAYMLAMPGTPCVFYKHWIDCKRDIKNMITLRNLVGITNTSTWTKKSGNNNIYVLETTGNNGKLIAAIGRNANKYTAPAGYSLAAEGHHWRYFIESCKEMAMPSLPSGKYYDKLLRTKLYAVSANSSAQLVYTLDGTEPTASNGTKVSSGTTITIPNGTITLKVGLLSGGKVSGVETRTYEHEQFTAYDIDVYVNVDKAGWTSVNSWTWGGNGSHASSNGWPGDPMTTTKTINNRTWYVYSTKMNTVDDFVSLVFSTGKDGKPQTVDVPKVTATSYFEVQSTTTGDKYNVTNVTSEITTGITPAAIYSNAAAQPTKVTALDGRTVRTFASATSAEEATQGLPAGLYIVNGKKVAVK